VGERTLLGVTGALALVMPSTAAWYLQHRIDASLEPALSDAVGTPVQIDHVEASLTGAVRVDGVRLGDLLAADHIEASMAPGTLLSGDFHADEIRVDGPRLRLRVDRDGGSNLDDLLARWRARHAARTGAAPAPAGATRLRRIVVTGGDLIVTLGDRARLRVQDVELVPHAGGLRALAGRAELEGASGPWTAAGSFARAAADLSWPALGIDRFLAVGGAIDLATFPDPSRAERSGARDALRHASIAFLPDRPGWRLAARIARAGRDARLRATVDRGAVELDMQDLPLGLLAPLAPRGLELADARATGTATVTGGGGVTLAVDATLSGGAIDHGRIAPTPVDLSGAIHLRGRIASGADPGGYAVSVAELAYDRGALHLRGQGSFDAVAGEHLPRRADLHAALERGDCAAMLAGLPESLRDRLGGLRLRGQAAATLALRWDLAAPDDTQLDVGIDAGACEVLAEPVVADVRALTEPFEHTFPDGSTVTIGMGHGDYTTLRSLPGHVLGAFVAAEDARFWDHRGFDLHQIERSLAINLADRGLTRGGSTISQQLVKNAFLGPERTLARKLQEAVLTWRLEAHVGKRLILERYLNLIELGPAVHGIGAAARYWFGKPAGGLQPLESAFLAALTPAPTTLSARLRAAGKVDDATADRVRTVLRHMRRAGVIDDATYERLRYERPIIKPPALASR
jgi:hypothetical protein